MIVLFSNFPKKIKTTSDSNPTQKSNPPCLGDASLPAFGRPDGQKEGNGPTKKKKESEIESFSPVKHRKNLEN